MLSKLFLSLTKKPLCYKTIYFVKHLRDVNINVTIFSFIATTKTCNNPLSILKSEGSLLKKRLQFGTFWTQNGRFWAVITPNLTSQQQEDDFVMSQK